MHRREETKSTETWDLKRPKRWHQLQYSCCVPLSASFCKGDLVMVLWVKVDWIFSYTRFDLGPAINPPSAVTGASKCHDHGKSLHAKKHPALYLLPLLPHNTSFWYHRYIVTPSFWYPVFIHCLLLCIVFGSAMSFLNNHHLNTWFVCNICTAFWPWFQISIPQYWCTVHKDSKR